MGRSVQGAKVGRGLRSRPLETVFQMRIPRESRPWLLACRVGVRLPEACSTTAVLRISAGRSLHWEGQGGMLKLDLEWRCSWLFQGPETVTQTSFSTPIYHFDMCSAQWRPTSFPKGIDNVAAHYRNACPLSTNPPYALSVRTLGLTQQALIRIYWRANLR